MSLTTRLATRMGYGAAPYIEQRSAPENEGDILIIEVVGKATPTATED